MAYIPSPSEYGLEVSRGKITGSSAFRKFGANGAVGTSATYIATLGGTSPYFPTAATTVRIKAGGNANDTAAGSGAQEITILGVDQNWAEQTVTLATAGASASSSTAVTFFRVYRAFVSKVGAYRGSNTGTITIEATAGGDFAQIAAGYGQSQGTGYVVPAGYSLYIKAVHIMAAAVKAVDIVFFQAPAANVVAATFTGGKRVIQQYVGVTGQQDFAYDPPMKIAAYTDVWATGLVASGTGSVSFEYNGFLIAN